MLSQHCQGCVLKLNKLEIYVTGEESSRVFHLLQAAVGCTATTNSRAFKLS